jgi:hypothetical protein
MKKYFKSHMVRNVSVTMWLGVGATEMGEGSVVV